MNNMIYLFLYILISIFIVMICGYYDLSKEIEMAGVITITLLWPILLPLVLILLLLVSPYFLGLWYKEYKTTKVDLITFLKDILS